MLRQFGNRTTPEKNSGTSSGRAIYDRPGFLVNISQNTQGYRSCAVPGKEHMYKVILIGVDHFTGGTYRKSRTFKHKIEAAVYKTIMSLFYTVEVK